ncbi:MAG TPA: helix-turn-helix domain-containing protein [Actinomycetota bacterium]
MRPLMLEPEKGSAEALRELVDLFRRLLASEGSASLEAKAGQFRIFGPTGEHVDIPDSVFQLLEFVTTDFEHGQAVAVLPIDKLLTTTEAAELLNVSRPYLARLLDQRVLPFEMVGTHHRVRLSDVLKYLEKKDAERRAALDEMVREGEELELPY